MKEENQEKVKKRKEFLAGFTAGLVCLGAAALLMLIIFSL